MVPVLLLPPQAQPLVTATLRLLLGGLLVLLTTALVRRWCRRQGLETPLNRRLIATGLPLALVAVAQSAWRVLPIDPLANQLFDGACGLVALVVVVRLVNALLEEALHGTLRRLGEAGGLATIGALLPMLRSVIWVLGSLVYLQNLGLRLTVVLGALTGAGLGIGFALQGPARDFFTYLTILLDRPFRIGDLLRFDHVAGRVVQVGLRTTHLRSLDGELVVVANSNLLAKTLHNFGDQQDKRVLQRLVLSHDNDPKALARVASLVQAAVDASAQGHFDHCHLQELAPSGAIYEVCYRLPSGDPAKAQASQQAINLNLLQGLQQAGIRWAEPCPGDPALAGTRASSPD